jgi:glycerol-3-phosphate dehydrogenase
MHHLFKRDLLIKQLDTPKQWDLIIIGGGATGLGIALDAACRGYDTLLLEQSDFAKGTSSRSTKLIHGGVRYLAQGNIRLVFDAVRERGLLLQNAPHLVKKQAFIIPCYSWFSLLKFHTGLKLYNWLSHFFSLGSSRFINRSEVINRLPGIKEEGLIGGIEYYDAQFDDARLAINLAQTATEMGGVVLNYCKVVGLSKKDGNVTGVSALDLETGKKYSLQAKVVINATGVFVDDILEMDIPGSKPLVKPSQGIHLVLDRSFLNTDTALLIPETVDGRVLFAVPWHNHVLVGTTDTPLDKNLLEPVALDKEVDFILQTVKQYLVKAPERNNVLSVFAGLRPLAAPQTATSSTKEISRDHKLIVSDSGLITITGGKWTTYRKMAEDTINKAVEVGSLKYVPCSTHHQKIYGHTTSLMGDHLDVYGIDAEKIRETIKNNPSLSKPLVENLPYTEAEVIWAVQNEMARTVEDVLARRLRILFLDAKAALIAAPKVAELMAAKLQYNEEWEHTQLKSFTKLANQYMINSSNNSFTVDEKIMTIDY